MPADDITTGELGRRMDEVRDNVRELLGKFDDLDSKFVPRAELDERHRLLDVQILGLATECGHNRKLVDEVRDDAAAKLDTYKADVAAARRWAIGTALALVASALVVVANIIFR